MYGDGESKLTPSKRRKRRGKEQNKERKRKILPTLGKRKRVEKTKKAKYRKSHFSNKFLSKTTNFTKTQKFVPFSPSAHNFQFLTIRF